MQSKNAVGNLINRYRAVLKKCNLLNTFGSLAMASALVFASAGMASAAFEPTLEQTATKNYLKSLTYDHDNDPATPEVRVYTDEQVSAISSSYEVTANVTAGSSDYYTTFTHEGITYGVLLKTPTGGTSKSIEDVIVRTDTAGNWQIQKNDGGIGDFTVNGQSFSVYDKNGNALTPVKPSADSSGNYTGNFIGNSNSSGNGGAISNFGTITSLTGDFIGNSADEHGGAIYNFGTITSLTGDFIGNSATYDGGAISNVATITSLTGDFIGNSATQNGGAISNVDTITSLIGDFIGNSATYDGGAISNNDTITSLTGDFIGNSADENGGAIFSRDTITSLIGDFIGNSATQNGGAISNVATITSLTGDFIGNSAKHGGAIYNIGRGTIGAITANFIGNSATSNGGAIYTTKDINFLADGTSQIISGNYTGSGATKDYNAIYMDADNLSLNFNLKNNGSYTLNDNVKGSSAYTVNITGDGVSTSIFNLNNMLNNTSVVNVANATLNFGTVMHDKTYSGSIGSATLNLLENVNLDTHTDTTFTGIVNIGNNITGSSVSLAANDTLHITNNGSLIIVNGSLDVSAGTLKVDANASSFSTAENTSLTAKASDFGTFGLDGSFTRTNTDNVQKVLDNSGTLILTDTGYSTISKGLYEKLLENRTLFTNGDGLVKFDGVSLSDYYSLDTVIKDYAQDQAIMAGTLSDNKNVSTSHLVANDTINDSTIERGSELTLTGSQSNTLSVGNITNNGTLNLGAEITGVGTIQGTLTNSGTVTASSALTVAGLNLLGGTTTFNGATIVSGVLNSNGTTTFNDTITLEKTLDIIGGITTFNAGLSANGAINVRAGATFNLANGDADLSKPGQLTTADGAILQSAIGTTLTVDIASIGINSQGATSGTAATVHENTNVTGLNGTVKITGFDSGLSLSYGIAYDTLVNAGKLAYGSNASLNFVNVNVDTSSTSLTDVASKNDTSLGAFSVNDGTVANGAVATVGSIRTANASGFSATNSGGTLNITGLSIERGQENRIATGDILTSSNGTTTLGNATSVSTVGGSVINDESKTHLLNVSITNNLQKNATSETIAQGTTSVHGDTQLGGGIFRTTNANASNDITTASASFLHNLPNGIDGKIIAEHNSYIVLGGDSTNNNRTYAEAAFAQTAYSWGTGVTSALFIVNSQILQNDGSVIVNGANTNITPAAPNNAKFTANSLLVVDGRGVGENAALASSTSGVLTVASSAKLYITNAISNTEIKIVEGFTGAGSSIADEAWDGDNLKTSSGLQVAKVEDFDINTGSYVVKVTGSSAEQIKEDFPQVQDSTAELLAELAKVANVNSPEAGIRFFSIIMDEVEGIGKKDPEEAAKIVESVLQIAQAGAGANMGINASFSAANNLIGRLSQAGFNLVQSPQIVQANAQTGYSAGSENMSNILNGLALWVSPMYKHSSVSGLKAGNFTQSYDSDIAGISLGGDYTFQNTYRFGIAFNVGTGSAESTGGLSKTKNDFDFYGISAYGAYYRDNLSLMADIGFSATKGEFSQDVNAPTVSDVRADTDSTNFTLGLKAEYTFNTKYMDVTPYAGVRYMYVHTDAYNTKDNLGVVAHTKADSQSIFYFPMGVTFSKEIVNASGWTFSPRLGLGLLAAAGDLHSNSHSTIAGLTASSEYEMQNVDEIAFDGGIGLDITNATKNLSFGLNYNLQASKHETGHMVNAMFRYEF